MIDLHCHLIPGVDDGAANLEEALAMARGAVEDGINRCVATPHWTGEPDAGQRVRDALRALREELQARCVPLEVHSGHEVVLVPRLLEELRSGGALTLADSSYVLLETAQLERDAFGAQAVFQLQAAGYRIIFAHPERVQRWQKDLRELACFVERGCLLQVNAGSLRGGFGGAAKRAADEIVRRGWASFVASDAHSPEVRPLLLGGAFRRCAELTGETVATALVETNPARVLCNEVVPEVVLEPAGGRRWFSFGAWRR